MVGKQVVKLLEPMPMDGVTTQQKHKEEPMVCTEAQEVTRDTIDLTVEDPIQESVPKSSHNKIQVLGTTKTTGVPSIIANLKDVTCNTQMTNRTTPPMNYEHPRIVTSTPIMSQFTNPSFVHPVRTMISTPRSSEYVPPHPKPPTAQSFDSNYMTPTFKYQTQVKQIVVTSTMFTCELSTTFVSVIFSISHLN